jgi:hypothetical protein
MRENRKPGYVPFHLDAAINVALHRIVGEHEIRPYAAMLGIDSLLIMASSLVTCHLSSNGSRFLVLSHSARRAFYQHALAVGVHQLAQIFELATQQLAGIGGGDQRARFEHGDLLGVWRDIAALPDHLVG